MHISAKTYSSFSLNYVVPLLVASILLPPIRLPTGLPAMRPELIIVLVAWGLFFLKYLMTRRPIQFRRYPAYKWFILFGLSIYLSISYATLIKGYPVIARDFWEFGKLLEYFLIFILIANLEVSPIDLRYYHKVALIIFLCSSAVGFAQFLHLGNINTVLYYYAPTQMEGFLAYGRITGTTGNPNEFGALMVLAASLALSGALFFQQRIERLLAWGCFGIFSLTIAFTLSRTSIVSLIIATSFMLLVAYPRTPGIRRGIWHLFSVIPVLIVLYLIIKAITPELFFARVITLKDAFHTGGWQARVVKWKYALELWKQSPVFGCGPAKAMLPPSVDNEWVLLLTRYGFIGIMIFVSWWISFYHGLSKACRGSSTMDAMPLVIALKATLLSYVVYMITAGVYHSLQLMALLLVFLGLAYSQSSAKSP